MNKNRKETMNEPMKTSPLNSPENQYDTIELNKDQQENNYISNVNSLNKSNDKKELFDGNKNYSDKELIPNKNGKKDYLEESDAKISEMISDSLTNDCDDSNPSTSEVEKNLVTNGTNNIANLFKNEGVTPTKIDELSKGSESSDEGYTIKSGALKEDDAVSINSDYGSDISEANEAKQNDSDIIILENDHYPESTNGNSQSMGNPEIHEIISDNDDCVSINDDKSSTSSIKVRHSNRRVKRRNYTEMENGNSESDIEEIEMEDPLNTKTIVISDTKDLVQMTAKKAKTSHNNNKKEHTVVIIDTKSKNSIPKPNTAAANTMSTNAQNLYQDIISMKARGTTITPISNKINTNIPIQNAPQSPTPQGTILPSLTDDMFVVEAPSFVVPYVYEKPSLKPFKEFVTKLGQELEQQKKKEKEEREKIRKEKKENGEPVSESDEEVDTKKKSDKKKRQRGCNEDDDDSWDGESSAESDDEIMSDDDVSTIKDKSDSMESEIPDKKHLKTDSYFDCSLGKFFVEIGANLVQEFVQSDLLKQQTKKLTREKKSGRSTRATESSITSLMKNLEFSKENNAPYIFSQKKCNFCSFKSESTLVMKHHLETPHMKNGLYKCNFCAFEIKNPHDILYHMDVEHKTRGRLERALACHQCTNCTYEDNGKGKLARHQVSCGKKFKPEVNMAPPVEWEPPAKIPKIVKPRNNVSTTVYHNLMNRQLPNNLNKQLSIANLMPSGMVGVGAKTRGRAPRAAAPLGLMHGVPILRGGATVRPSKVVSNTAVFKNNGKPKATHQPSISITPLPHQPLPVVQPTPQYTKGTFVICEICDGYIKDLEQLRNHMQWIHRVKIHPKMIYNRPPLNCQKCQFRFFTDQGLERHLLGSHGLVTSSMQDAANKGKDAGRCPVCGRVYQWKLLNHVSKDHGMTLKPAHLSYKCTVCTATFGMYKQFEHHVYSVHSLRINSSQTIKVEKSKLPPVTTTKPGDSAQNQLKINDEVTITPQPVNAASSKSYKCTVCTATFGMYKQFENHVYSAHSRKINSSLTKTVEKSKLPPVTTTKPGDSAQNQVKINDKVTITPQPVNEASSKDN